MFLSKYSDYWKISPIYMCTSYLIYYITIGVSYIFIFQ